MSMINLTDLRLSASDHTASEIYNSLFALTWFVFALIFPFFIVGFYAKKIKLDRPLSNLRDNMTIKQLKNTYGTVDIDEIRKNAYTVEKHNEFMEKYGILLNDIDIKKIGKNLALAVVFINLYRKFLLAASIMIFINYPSFVIFSFNFNVLFYIIFINWNTPYIEHKTLIQIIVDEYILLVVNYHLFCFTDWTDNT